MGGGYDKSVTEYRPYILESFFYADEDTERLMPHFGDFLLDSGAFTFMQGKGGSPNWDEYVERYADFINRNKVQKYFELDIDSVVGYERVKQIRSKLERLTGRQSIPVWHLSRGMDEYRGMCKDYNYVAIGGIVSGEITKDKYKAFPALIAEAHNHGARIHGLGFTNLALLPHYLAPYYQSAFGKGNQFTTFENITLIKQAIISQNMASILGGFAVFQNQHGANDQLKAIRLKNYKKEDFISTYLIYRKEKKLNAMEKILLRCVKECFSDAVIPNQI